MLSIGIRKSEGRCAKNVNRVRSERRNEAEDASDAWDIFVCYLAMEAKFSSHLSQDGVEFCPKSPRWGKVLLSFESGVEFCRVLPKKSKMGQSLVLI